MKWRRLLFDSMIICLCLGPISGLNDVFGGTLDDERATDFLHALHFQAESLPDYIDLEDLAFANRLGITYREAPCKALIAWGYSSDVGRFDRENLNRRLLLEQLPAEYTRLSLVADNDASSGEWIFHRDKVVSAVLYRTREWAKLESKYFRFVISDTTLFHPANIESLEKFLVQTAAQLGLTENDLAVLADNKIEYVFCRNAEEVRTLTGYGARGMYLLSHDIIVSIYGSHLHELAHLLINFKLRKLHLYTHPLFLEGFAVALGGRGGKSTAVVGQLGQFLFREGWLAWPDLLVVNGGAPLNASLAYPGYGFYNQFLIKTWGMAAYLKSYADHGGEASSVPVNRVAADRLPSEAIWARYVEGRAHTGAVHFEKFAVPDVEVPVLFQSLAGGRQYGFRLKETTLALSGPAATGYKSFVLAEFAQDLVYAGERYLIRVSTEEIGIYDLYLNTLIAHYAMAFSADQREVPQADGFYTFRVDRSAFAHDVFLLRAFN